MSCHREWRWYVLRNCLERAVVRRQRELMQRRWPRLEVWCLRGSQGGGRHPMGSSRAKGVWALSGTGEISGKDQGGQGH